LEGKAMDHKKAAIKAKTAATAIAILKAALKSVVSAAMKVVVPAAIKSAAARQI
jgi:hypothetical protein